MINPKPLEEGLILDLHTLSRQKLRRLALRSLIGAGTIPLLGCGSGADSDPGESSDDQSDTNGSGSTGDTPDTGTDSETVGTVDQCSTIPDETAGPYPADGSNGQGGSTINALSLSGIERRNLVSNFAGAPGADATGVPLTVSLRLVSSLSGCSATPGYAVYLWHCDAQGRYSMYSAGVTAQNYLRGVQQADANGAVTFETIVPGCYDGRMPHMHFEIYPSLDLATSYQNRIKTSQLALPTDFCTEIYGASSQYTNSQENLARISFATDNVFSDGVSSQMVQISGNATEGYQASLVVGLPV